MYEAQRAHWNHRPGVLQLNHGSFGGVPRVVLEHQQRLRDEMEGELLRFMAPERELEAKLDATRERLAAFLGARFEDLAFVRNATDGCNAVLRSYPLAQGDEIVVTNHGYNACSNAARFVCERAGASVKVAQIPFPIQSPSQAADAIEAVCTERTRLILVDYVTSPTALILPVDEIVRRAHARGIRVLVDGAHAPGMFPVDLRATGADYMTGNLHKWLCAPKVGGFLHVREELQAEVRPTVISHAANTPRPSRSRFLAEFDWVGTFDPTPLLSVPAALDFLDGALDGGHGALMERNRGLALEGRAHLCERLGLEAPAPDEMIGSIATLLLPDGPPAPEGKTDLEQQRLYADHGIEVPIFHWSEAGKRCLRISAQLYNESSDYERLADAMLAGKRTVGAEA